MYDVGYIAVHGGCLVGVRGIGDELDGCFAGMVDLSGKVIAKHYYHIGLPLFKQLVYLIGTVQYITHVEIGICPDTFGNLTGIDILGRVEDGHAGVLHLGGDGKTE